MVLERDGQPMTDVCEGEGRAGMKQCDFKQGRVATSAMILRRGRYTAAAALNQKKESRKYDAAPVGPLHGGSRRQAGVSRISERLFERGRAASAIGAERI